MWGSHGEFIIDGNLKSVEYVDRLPTIHVPTLIVVGDHDECDPSLSREMHQKIAGSQLAILPNAGHMNFVDQPAMWQAGRGRISWEQLHGRRTNPIRLRNAENPASTEAARLNRASGRFCGKFQCAALPSVFRPDCSSEPAGPARCAVGLVVSWPSKWRRRNPS